MCGRYGDVSTRGRRPDEYHFADVSLGDEALADGVAKAGNDIDQPLWYTGTLDQYADHQRRQRGQLRGLEDDGVASGDGRCNLPAAGKNGGVPRRDLQNGAQGFVGHIVQMGGGNRNDFAVQFVCPTRVVLEHFGDLGHLDPGITDRFVRGQRFDLREAVGLFANQCADSIHHTAARLRSQRPPLGLSGPGNVVRV